jgi:hypothetical protein
MHEMVEGGKNMQPIRVYAADGVPITQTGGKLDVNAVITSGAGDATAANQTTQIALVDLGYKGQDISTTTGATEAFTIPANSTLAIISASKDSEGYININAAATSPSALFVNEMAYLTIRLKGVTALNVWALTGTIGVVFYG